MEKSQNMCVHCLFTNLSLNLHHFEFIQMWIASGFLQINYNYNDPFLVQ